jgi:hypothetical protein
MLTVLLAGYSTPISTASPLLSTRRTSGRYGYAWTFVQLDAATNGKANGASPGGPAGPIMPNSCTWTVSVDVDMTLEFEGVPTVMLGGGVTVATVV